MNPKNPKEGGTAGDGSGVPLNDRDVDRVARAWIAEQANVVGPRRHQALRELQEGFRGDDLSSDGSSRSRQPLASPNF